MSQKFIRSQAGQTLIETIVAIFILTMALTSGLGLAVYSLNSAMNSKSQTIAANLAREGIDGARMMRDSNWLDASVNQSCAGGSAHPCSCPDIGNQPCYPHAFEAPSPYDFQLNNAPPQVNQWRMMFDPLTRNWSLATAQTGAGGYLLCLQPSGLYLHDGNGVTCTTGNFARRIIVEVRPGPDFGYSQTDLDNAEVIIRSVVVWSGKNCPPLDNTTVPGSDSKPCKVIAEERLTNWKDYR